MADKKRILIVDDSDVVAGVLTQLLEERGYEVLRACDGMAAVISAYRSIPDLIVMDVEMPVLQGYQASRLLKSRRGVKEIPIIMHTSLSEDRDKYWALSSGADAFVTKDFDNLEVIGATVSELVTHPPVDLDLIAEEAKSIDESRVLEMLGSLYDSQLFHSTILNLLGDIGRSITSVPTTARDILSLLTKVCETHASAIVLKFNSRAHAYVYASDAVFREDVKDFLDVCLSDFVELFPAVDMDDLSVHYFGAEGREDFEDIRLDGRRLSSYTRFKLAGNGGAPVGTLHIGNLTNNYFSGMISSNLRVFAEGAAMVIDNAVLFGQVNEMQTKIRHVFSKFVPKEIIDDLIQKRSDEALMVGEKRSIAVLFSDIRSFTTISEENSAEAVVSFLNDHFRVMVDIIDHHGGSVDKFIGDAILAVFGAPLSFEDNALRAVRAAYEMIEAMPRVRLDGLNLPEVGYAIGIGLHQGQAIVGNIGSSEKFDYTVIGDTVNVASRLEELTKHYRKKILLSEEMASDVAKEFELREVDKVRVKGKSEATSIYCVEHDDERLPPAAADNYAKGLKLYRLGNWESADGYFRQVLAECPEDFLASEYIERCHRFGEDRPSDWDGSIALDFK